MPHIGTPSGVAGLGRVTALGVVATLAVILPAFLTGAMAVQVRAGLSMTESEIGLAIGAFFVGSAAGSMILGRLAERLGPLAAVRLGLVVTAATDLAIAAAASGPRSLLAMLLVAGTANALTQPAVNLLLVRAVDPRRLGLIMALKQSGMPAAALVGGLAVPLVALTVGWRAGYLMATVVAVIALALSGAARSGPGTSSSRPPDHRRGRNRPVPEDEGRGVAVAPVVAKPDLGWRMLWLMAAVGVLGGGAANILVGYLVSGAVAAGVSPGPAGLLLTFGSALGIASRLANGWAADRASFDVLLRVILLFAIGTFGALGLMVNTPIAYLLATPVVFAAGWAWPGLFNLVVVNANRSAPAAATGVTQTGVYVGSLIGPVVAGLIIERSGYGATWLLTAASLAGAAMLAAAVRLGMAGERGRPSAGSREGQVEPIARTR